MRRINIIGLDFLVGLSLAVCSCEKASLGLPDILTEFSAALKVVTPSVSDGADFRVEIHSNRGFRLEKLSCEWAARDFQTGCDYEPAHDGVLEVVFPSVSVSQDHQGKVSMLLYDSHTGRTVELKADYKAYARRIVYPSGITLSSDSLTVDWYDESSPEGGIVSFLVGMTPENSETGFSVEVVPGSVGSLSVSTSKDGQYGPSCAFENNGGEVFVKGGSTGGRSVLKVCAASDPSVCAYVDVYVRHRVALMVAGIFRNNHCVPCAHSAQNEIGWFGIPSSLYCRLVSWTLSSSSGRTIEDVSADNIDGLEFRRFDGASGEFDATFRLTVSPESRESNFFYGPNEGNPERLVVNADHSANNVTATLSLGNGATFAHRDMSVLSDNPLDDLCRAVSQINDHCDWVGYWWFMNIQCYYSPTGWTNVGITLEDIDYDRGKLDLRYCLYMFSAKYTSGNYCGPDTYWWSAVDHVRWIQNLKSE